MIAAKIALLNNYQHNKNEKYVKKNAILKVIIYFLNYIQNKLQIVI